MITHVQKIRTKEQGFTLVELAVVMIIIGVLIGGILKGQELITNARVTSTATQLESMSAAVNGFQDAYAALPGDMALAQQRLPNCTNATFCFNGGGNNIVNNPVGAANVNAAASANRAAESTNFFIHLSRGEFITGVEASSANVGVPATHPAAPIGGAFAVGDRGAGASSAGFVTARTGNTDLTGRIYLTIVNTPAAAAAAANGPITAQQAARIDRKLDDGAPNTGSLLSSIGAAASCRTAANSALYDEANNSAGCNIAYALR